MKPMPMPEYHEPTIAEEIESRRKQVEYQTKQRYVNEQIRAHDINGFESEMIQPDGWGECFGDAYGNNVAHGDQSVLRMVETGNREPQYLTPVDTDPYASKRQARFFHAAAQRGEISEKTVKEYDKATDFKHLPERARKK